MDRDASKIINILIIIAFLLGPIIIKFFKKASSSSNVRKYNSNGVANGHLPASDPPPNEFTQALANFLSAANLNPEFKRESENIMDEEESETRDEHTLVETAEPVKEMSKPTTPAVSINREQIETVSDDIDFEKLFDSPKSVRAAIVMREIFDKPVALRRL